MFISRSIRCLIFTFIGLSIAYEFTYEDYDYESMLKNERLVNGIVECLLSDEPCNNPIFEEVKKYAPEILETTCGKCTEVQKQKFKKCTNIFMKQRPDDYEKIIKKYDPDNKYRPALEAFLASPDR